MVEITCLHCHKDYELIDSCKIEEAVKIIDGGYGIIEDWN